MKHSGYIIALSFIVLIQSIGYCQHSINYTPISSQTDNFVFTRIIGGEVYHFSHKIINNEASGSEIVRIEEDEAIGISWIYQINDTLFCHHLIDMWQENQKTYLLAYTFTGGQNSISLLGYNIDNDEIKLIESTPFSQYRFIHHNNFKDFIVNGSKKFILIEHEPSSNKINGLTFLNVLNEQFERIDYIYDDPVSSFRILDLFFDLLNKRYYVLIGSHYLFFNETFEFILQQQIKVMRGDTTYLGAESVIVGQDSSKIVSYERRNIDNIILSKRYFEVLDTFVFDPNYLDFNSDEDCYLVRKVFKNTYNYIFYSRSSNTEFDDKYGFNILTFNKQGELLNNQVFESERPMSVFDIDIDEDLKIVSGVGSYFDDFTQFSFTADLEKVVVNTLELVHDKPNVLISNVGNLKLNINPEYFNEKALIFNINGQVINNLTLKYDLNISNLAKGTYILQTIKNGSRINEKFVKI